MMPKLPDDKSMKQGDNHYQYSEKVICIKWKDNHYIVLLGSNIDVADDCSSVQRYEKEMSSKNSLPSPQLVKRCKKEMEGVDFMDQLTSTYRLDRRSKTWYCLRLFFDLWDMASLIANFVYGKLTQKKFSHLDFQVTLVKSLISNYNNKGRNPQTFTRTKHVSGNFSTETGSHKNLVKLETSRGRCHYCKNQGNKNRAIVKCNTCGCSYALWLLHLLQSSLTSINKIYLLRLILQNQHYVPYFCSIIL